MARGNLKILQYVNIFDAEKYDKTTNKRFPMKKFYYIMINSVGKVKWKYEFKEKK